MRNIFRNDKGNPFIQVSYGAFRIFQDVRWRTTDVLCYMALLFVSDFTTGRVHGRVRVRDVARTIGVGEQAVRDALVRLNERGLTSVSVKRNLRGTVLVRCRSKKDDAAEECPFALGHAMVHRHALREMVEYGYNCTNIRQYWFHAMNCDVRTGRLHEFECADIAGVLGLDVSTVYRSRKQMNVGTLADIRLDVFFYGHLPLVALANGELEMIKERKREEGRHVRSASATFERLRRVLYEAFGVPVERMSRAQVKKAIGGLRDKLETYDVAARQFRGGLSRGRGNPAVAT